MSSGQIPQHTAAEVEIHPPLVVGVVVDRVIPNLAADGPVPATGVHSPEAAAGPPRINIDDRASVGAPAGIELVSVTGGTVHARKRVESGDIDTGGIDTRVQPAAVPIVKAAIQGRREHVVVDGGRGHGRAPAAGPAVQAVMVLDILIGGVC